LVHVICGFAVIAGLDGVLSYPGFERDMVVGLLRTAICNTFLAIDLLLDPRRGERGFRFPKLVWLGFAASTARLLSYLIPPRPRMEHASADLVAASALDISPPAYGRTFQ
jgi:hypothetical protein